MIIFFQYQFYNTIPSQDLSHYLSTLDYFSNHPYGVPACPFFSDRFGLTWPVPSTIEEGISFVFTFVSFYETRFLFPAAVEAKTCDKTASPLRQRSPHALVTL